MENQIESDMELRDSLNRDLRVRKQVEDLFYLINPYFDPEIGISKHVFLRSVQLDENVRSALLVWPQLKVLGQPKLYINALKRLDTNEDNTEHNIVHVILAFHIACRPLAFMTI